jgi:pimeloyl-ACP methyl ester carboxylesterase
MSGVMSDLNDIPAMGHEIKGSGDALIFVPGGLTGWRSWQAHAEAFAGFRRTIRVQLHNVALGLAGAQLPAGYSVAYEVAALGKTLDALAIQQADFVAWSYGTAIALSYALHHRQRVRSLTLIEPSAYWVLRSRGPLPREAEEEQRFLETLATGEVSEAQLAEAMHVFKFAPQSTDPRTLPEWPVLAAHRQSLRMADAEFRHEDSMALLRRFNKPVLLVKGTASNLYTHDVVDVLAQELPHARAVAMAGGHAPHLEAPQRFTDLLARFLSNEESVKEPAPPSRQSEDSQ